MRIEQQVTSRELSERIKALGVKQESTFRWYECFLNEDENGKYKTHWALFLEEISIDPKPPVSDLPDWYDGEDFSSGKEVSAFTVAELGEMLPATPIIEDKLYNLESCKHGKWDVKYVYYENGVGYLLGGYPKIAIADTEAEARGLCLIYLLENGLLKQ